MSFRVKNGLIEDWADFAANTSSHGIPRAYISEGFRCALWYLLFFFCFFAFSYQAVLIVERYQRCGGRAGPTRYWRPVRVRTSGSAATVFIFVLWMGLVHLWWGPIPGSPKNDIIVGVEIKFERIRFPAVTICNMNPYKNSAARESSGIKSALESFEHAIHATSAGFHHTRRKRSLDYSSRVISSYVYCNEEDGHFYPDGEGAEQCICASFEHDSAHHWNCAPVAKWELRLCPNSNVTVSNSSQLCYCNGGYCIEASQQIKISGRWPLSISFSSCTNSTCLCISPHNALESQYCAPISEWQYTQCYSCDWWGRCSRSFGPLGDSECVCDSQSTCFAVEQTREQRHRRDADKQITEEKWAEPNTVRIERANRIYERILSHYEGLLAVYSKCNCTKAQGCTAVKEMESSTNSSSACLCFFNKKNDQIWPCYEQNEWAERKCSRCSTFGDCTYSESQKRAQIDCFCAMPIKMCVRIDPPEGNVTDLADRIVKFWDILPATTVSPVQKKKQDREKAYGYTGVRDPIALKSKAMENIIYAVDQLTEQEKWRISYNKSDFILKCSFNGKECQVNSDFEAYLDPSYGACFTYVASKMENVTNERAGPAYGLRLEVFVNVTEYLPTTEAAGVRLTVHAHEEQPFPDTLGYSAPTGFVSSFGIKLKSMTRLPAPYGDCIKEGKDADFIYKDKAYSTEGCQRSCIQRHLALTCGCGDPRFPPFRNTKNCPVDEPDKRTCIKEQIAYATRNAAAIGCKCRQPCAQDVYSVSYSASRWPAVPGDQSGCPQAMAPQHCLVYKREQGAMIEVFFEQLNYESLLESEAYGLPNLLSDFGGQLGLWMGVSVITIMELGIFGFDVIATVLTCGNKRRKRKVSKRSSSSLRYSLSRPA